MGYGYNSQGQLVWQENGTPQGGAALPVAEQTGTFIPSDHTDMQSQYEGNLRDNGTIERLNGPAPPGYEYNADGTLHKIRFLNKLESSVLSPTGMALGIAGMALAPGIGGLFGRGAAETLPGFELTGDGAASSLGSSLGSGLVSTAPRISLQSILAKALPGAIKGGLTGGWKGALEGAVTGGMGGAKLPVYNGGGMDLSTGGGGMSWLDTLKGALGGSSSTADAGGETNGGSWLDVIKGAIKNYGGIAANTAGSIEKGREAGRTAENNWNLSSDRTALQALQDYENALEGRGALDLKQRQFGLDAQNQGFRNAMRAALGKNIQDVSISGTPSNIPITTFSGGLRPSAMGQEGRDASGLMYDLAMKSLRDGTHFDPLPPVERFTPTKYKGGNVLDTVLGTAGAIGGAIDQADAKKSGNQQTTMIQKILAQMDAEQKAKAAKPAPVAPPPIAPIDPNATPYWDPSLLGQVQF